MLAVVIASTWMNMGGAMLIYLAALQNIPGELYEAAELDGAGLWRRIWHVTIPQTRLILSLMLMLQIVATMQVFIEPLILRQRRGPEDSATRSSYLIYQYGFFQNDLNGAAALGVIMLVVLAGFSAVYVRLSRETGLGRARTMAHDSGRPGPSSPTPSSSRRRGRVIYWTLLDRRRGGLHAGLPRAALLDGHRRRSSPARRSRRSRRRCSRAIRTRRTTPTRGTTWTSAKLLFNTALLRVRRAGCSSSSSTSPRRTRCPSCDRCSAT